jgi:class 3 adenylate cyclase
VLVTTAVHELAQGKGFGFDQGTVHQLKGFDQPVTLWRLELPEPPPATAAAVRAVTPSNPDADAGMRD